MLRFLGNNSYANDPQYNVLTLSILLLFNRDTKKEREREKEGDAYGNSESHIFMGRRRRTDRVLLVFFHARPARPTGSSMKVKIYEAEEE